MRQCREDAGGESISAAVLKSRSEQRAGKPYFGTENRLTGCPP